MVDAIVPNQVSSDGDFVLLDLSGNFGDVDMGQLTILSEWVAAVAVSAGIRKGGQRYR